MKKEKKIFTTEEIDEKLKQLSEDENKKNFLKHLYKDEDYKKLRKKIVKDYAQLILKKPVENYELVYDSLSEGLEPIYYWILDFMRDASPGGLGLNVFKGPEEFEASVSSGYFGEIGQRSSLMQQKAGEYLGAINQVIKSILNLIYDLNEFKIRLDIYEQLRSPETKEGALYSLKALWMDTVDSKKGRGSINLLAQDLQFYTLRDAFFYIQNEERIKDLDLNERVRNLLRIKLKDFTHWLEKSEQEIRKRYNVERAYLRSQAGSLKLYAGWAKPYLKAAQKLKMKEFNMPDIVNSFSNIEIKISLLGEKQVTPDPAKIHPSFKDIKLDTNYSKVIVVDMDFRGVPSAITTQGGRQYVHGGRAEIKFKAYALDDTEIAVLKARELYEDMDLVDTWVETSMDELQAEIDDYLNPKKEETKIPTHPPIEWPLQGTLKGFKEMFGPLTDLAQLLKPSPPKELIQQDLKEHTIKSAKGALGILYTVYKKSHGMITP